MSRIIRPSSEIVRVPLLVAPPSDRRGLLASSVVHSRRRVRGATNSAGGGGGGGSGGWAIPSAPFFNSQEPRDANTLFADDFARGSWYACDGDHTSVGGVCNDGGGWGGTIFGPGGNGSGSPNPPCYGPPNGAATQTCNFGPSTWCAEHQLKDDSIGASTMAEHMLVNGANSETEIYLRWYQRFSIGYQYSAEKCFTINRDTGGGIDFGNVHFNVGAGSLSSLGGFQWQPKDFDTTVSSGFNVTGNMHWNCMILHIKLNTAGATPGTDGTLALYADDCGTSGISHPSTPTLRVQRTNFQFPRISSGMKIGNIFKENWANTGTQGSSGKSDLAYVYCSRVAVPFVDSWP